MNITLYRASEDSPLLVPSKEVYGDQYALYQLADNKKPRHAIGRLDAIFTTLSVQEAKQWGTKVYKLEADIPYSAGNAFDITKWTELVEYYLLNAFKDTPETNRRINELINAYWQSQTPIKDILKELEIHPEQARRWEVMISPQWVHSVSELQDEISISREGNRRKWK